MKNRFAITAVIALAGTFLAPVANGQDLTPVDPFRLEPLTDAAGKRWDVRDDGSISDGTNDCFDGALDMQIGSTRLRYMFQRKRRFNRAGGAPGGGIWNKQGDEYVFGPLDFAGVNDLQGLELTRRIGLTPDKKWLRYVEIFENKTAKERTLSFQMRFDFGSALQSMVTNTGKNTLGKKDFGVGYTQRPGRPFVVRILRAPNARKFEIEAKISGDFAGETYGPIKIPANGRVAIAHFAAQVDQVGDFETYFKAFKAHELLKDLPTELRRDLLNFSSGITIEGLSVPREESSDLVVLRSGKQLLGRIEAGSVKIQTIAGVKTISAKELIGLEMRGASDERLALVGCRDKQVFAGRIVEKQLPFTLSSGQKIVIKYTKIKSVGTSSAGDEESAKTTVVPGRFVRLRSGDHLGIEDLAAPVKVVTRYGMLEIPLKGFRSINLSVDGNWGHQLELTNGSRFGGLILDSELKSFLTVNKGAEGSEPVAIRRDLVLSIVTTGEDEPVRPPAGTFALDMRNGDKLLCALQTSKLNLESEFGTIELKTSDVRGLQFSEAGRVEVKLWDGSQLSGRLEEPLLELQLGKLPVKVPTTLVVNMEQTSFKLPSDLEAEVLKLIAALDAGDFEERDRAESTLVRLGNVVRPYLDQAAAAKDVSPEKTLRIQAVFKELGPDTGVTDVKVAELRKRLADSKDNSKRTKRAIVRALKSIWKAQRVYHDEDRDKNNVQDYGDLAALAKAVGKEQGIDEQLGSGEKYGYSFETGPSVNEKASQYLWWAVATPKDGKGPHFFMHHSGTVFVSKEAFEVDKDTCDPPASATRLEE